jgi:hypothetical protein
MSNVGPSASTPSWAAPGYGSESPMPGREKDFTGQAGAAVPASTAAPTVAVAAPSAAPPPISEERRSKSPGMRNNFYETSTADFKRPHGMPATAAPEPEPPQPATAEVSSVGPSPPVPSWAAPGYGSESPMPGREQDFAGQAAPASVAAPTVAVATPSAAPPPPISEERRSKSPGMRNNFYETSTADFKRPHGAAPMAAPAQVAPAQAEQTFQSTYDASTTDSMAAYAGAGGVGGAASPPPPIDETRRRKSPGLQNNVRCVLSIPVAPLLSAVRWLARCSSRGRWIETCVRSSTRSLRPTSGGLVCSVWRLAWEHAHDLMNGVEETRERAWHGPWVIAWKCACES